jgi:hypothetical protein
MMESVADSPDTSGRTKDGPARILKSNSEGANSVAEAVVPRAVIKRRRFVFIEDPRCELRTRLHDKGEKRTLQSLPGQDRQHNTLKMVPRQDVPRQVGTEG